MTAASHPKVIAFDLDGTLAESKQPMSADMGGLLGELLKKMPVAVMSGGGWKQFEKQFLPALPEGMLLDRLYLFPTSAALCLVHRNGAWHPQYDHTFSPETKTKGSPRRQKTPPACRGHTPARAGGLYRGQCGHFHRHHPQGHHQGLRHPPFDRAYRRFYP